MRVKATLTVIGIGLAGAFAVGPSAPAAPSSGPQPVVVTNTTPVPVSGTVNLGGSITSTITGTPTVSATVTNAAANPVPTTNSDRPTAFNQLVATTTTAASVPIPTGCRLVVQLASFFNQDPGPTPHTPVIYIKDPTGAAKGGQVWIPATTVITVNANATITIGTIAMQLIVDSPNTLWVYDSLGTAYGQTTIAGYLLPLTPGPSC